MGPFNFPRLPKPPDKSNPWVNPMSAATLAAGIALLFDSEVLAAVFLGLAIICLALIIYTKSLNHD